MHVIVFSEGCDCGMWLKKVIPLLTISSGLLFPGWVGEWEHGPACIDFHCPHPIYHSPWAYQPFAKTWVSLQTTTYKSKSTKYFDILLLLTCEEVLHAPTVQIWAQNSTILTPNNLLIVCYSTITNWSQTEHSFRIKA